MPLKAVDDDQNAVATVQTGLEIRSKAAKILALELRQHPLFELLASCEHTRKALVAS